VCAARMRGTVAFVMAGLLACEGTAPPPRPTRTVANSRRVGTSGGRSGRRELRTGANPPAVDSVRQCPQETFRTLARYRGGGRTIHFGPLCTGVFNGRFSAVMATGTEREASDVWVLFHDPRGDEIHRVRRFPVGAHITHGKILQGWVYLVGEGNAIEDMPSETKLLAIFPLPRPGDTVAPEVGLLSPLETHLLRATDATELERRLAFPVPGRDPSAREAQAALTRIAEGGPNTLLDHLSPEGAPTLRAWQVGMFQETDYVSPQGDPTNPHVTRTVTLLREVARAADCTAGDRCVAQPQEALPNGAAPAQALLSYDGQRVVVAGLLAAHAGRSTDNASADTTPWSAETIDDGEATELAASLTLDGQVSGHVVSVSRGTSRAVAFQVGLTRGGADTRLYVITPGHAPRPYVDTSAGGLTMGSQEIHLRDYERDGGVELVTFGRLRDNAVGVSIASVDAPPTVAQRALTHRLDMLRASFGDTSLREFDAHLRGFRSDPAEAATGCATLERVAGGEPRALVAATGGSFAVIPYTEAWQPLRGAPRRVTRRELQRAGAMNELLGPFAGKRCADLVCDWAQSVCRIPGDQDQGVLWLSDAGRRLAAVSLRQ